VLVTGANGFAGSAIARHLRAQSWRVRGSVRRDDAVVPSGVEKIVTGPLDGATDWSRAPKGIGGLVDVIERRRAPSRHGADLGPDQGSLREAEATK